MPTQECQLRSFTESAPGGLRAEDVIKERPGRGQEHFNRHVHSLT